MTNLHSQMTTLMTVLNQLTTGDQHFANSLISQYKQKGTLSKYQTPYVEKLILRATKPITPKATVIDVGTFSKVVALFETAKATLKYPKVTLLLSGASVKLSLAGVKAKNPGSININGEGKYPNNTWYGKVFPDGSFVPNPKIPADIVMELTALLTKFAEQPARVAKAYGKLTGSCAFCGKTLGLGEDQRSVKVGYGPVCAERWLGDAGVAAWKAAANTEGDVKQDVKLKDVSQGPGVTAHPHNSELEKAFLDDEELAQTLKKHILDDLTADGQAIDLASGSDATAFTMSTNSEEFYNSMENPDETSLNSLASKVTKAELQNAINAQLFGSLTTGPTIAKILADADHAETVKILEEKKAKFLTYENLEDGVTPKYATVVPKMTPEQIAVTAKDLAMHTVNFAEIEQNIVAHYDTFDFVAPAGSKCLFCGSEAKLLKQDQTLCVACADELEL